MVVLAASRMHTFSARLLNERVHNGGDEGGGDGENTGHKDDTVDGWQAHMMVKHGLAHAHGHRPSGGANDRGGDEDGGVDGGGGDGDVVENATAGGDGGGGEQDEPFCALPIPPMSRLSMAAGRRCGCRMRGRFRRGLFIDLIRFFRFLISSGRARRELSIAPFGLKFG